MSLSYIDLFDLRSSRGQVDPEETRLSGLLHLASQNSPLVGQANEFVKKFSSSNDAPYHNFYHVQCVAAKAFEGAVFSILSTDSKVDLVLAALFHDFNHSAGRLSDDQNIENAVNGFLEFSDVFDIPPSRAAKIVELIRSTEYPYKQDPQSLEAAILRDADLMQILHPHWEQMILQGLAFELESQLKEANETTDQYYARFGQACSSFYMRMPFHSPWAQEQRAYFDRVVLERCGKAGSSHE